MDVATIVAAGRVVLGALYFLTFALVLAKLQSIVLLQQSSR